MRADVAEGVLAEEPPLDLHALEAEAVGGELRHFLVREAVLDRQAFGVACFLQELAEAHALAIRDVDVFADFVDRALDVPHALRKDLERVAEVVARDDHAVAVDHQASVGRDRHHRDAVVLGLRAIHIVLQHLQVEEARREERERHQHGDAGDADAHLELLQLLLGIPDLAAAHGLPRWSARAPGAAAA